MKVSFSLVGNAVWPLSIGQLVAVVFALLACQATSSPNTGVRFSKLLNEKSEFLRFTSIANQGQGSPQFQNVYNRADSQQNSQLYYDYPQLPKVLTAPSGDEEYVRIRQELRSEPETQVDDPSAQVPESDATLTRINQKPIQGRAQVTALRQSIGGKGLNISPVFLSSDAPTTNQIEAVSLQDSNNNSYTVGPTPMPNEDEEEEVTTAQNFEVVKEIVVTERPTTTLPTINLVSVEPTPVPRIGITIFDNRTNPDPIDSTTPVSLDLEEKENLVAESFHRSAGNFPDFEDLPTNLAGAESSQPARVNVRPASSGKNYEYEYIYYYYDDEDEENATTAQPPSSTTTRPAIFRGPAVASEPSNYLEPERVRTQKAVATSQEVVSVPNPGSVSGLTPQLGGNRPVMIKQSNMPQPLSAEQPFPVVPRGHPNLPSQTTPPPLIETTTVFQNKFRSQPPAANQFEPPVLQFQFIDTPAPTPPPDSSFESRNRFAQAPLSTQTASGEERSSQEVPSPRRNPSRRPFVRPEPELQQRVPPTVQEYTVPAQLVTENTSRTRQSPAPLQGQFQPPLVPSRGTNAIVEVQSPSLITTTTAEAQVSYDDRQARAENFARQKSINDLYALSRLHQLAINTKIPDSNRRTPPPRSANIPAYTRAPEVSTAYPDPMEQSESTTISSFATAYLTTTDLQRVAYTTTEEASMVSPSNEVTLKANVAPTARDQTSFKDRVQGRYRGKPRTLTAPGTTTTTTTTEAPLRTYQHNRFAGRRRNFPASSTPAAVEEPSEGTPSAQSYAPTASEVSRGIPSRAPTASGGSRVGPSRATTASDVSRVAPSRATTESDVSSAVPTRAPTASDVSRVVPNRAPAASDVSRVVPGRSRFAGRSRPTTSTEAPEPSSTSPPATPPRRRPLAGGAVNPRRRFSTSTTPPATNENADVQETQAEYVPEPPPSHSSSEEPSAGSRQPSLPRVRTRPNGIGPIVGRPLRGGRTSTTTTSTTTTTENPDIAVVTIEESETPGIDTVDDTVGTTILEGSDPAPTVQVQEPSPGVVTHKVSVSSSTTTLESAAEPPNRGSSGVLGRLRNRSKISIQSTTAAPEALSSTTERKASRVGGILNRRKASTTTSSPVAREASPLDVDPGRESAQEGVPPEGVIVRVSSVVSETESDEVPDAHQVEPNPSSSAPAPQQGSILNRLKSQRKPGSLFRRQPEH